MRVLVIGSGAREDAIAWKLSQSVNSQGIYSLPGNISMARLGPTYDGDTCDFDAIAQVCATHSIDLIAVGPEIPLSAGIADYFKSVDVCVFGPSKQSAKLESSKSFAKNVLKKLGVPSPTYHTFQDPVEANNWIDHNDGPLVIKADGLAAGKGVFIAETKEEQRFAVASMMSGRIFGDAGDQIVIEEKITGPEVSVFGFCDGYDVSDLVVACDYKRIFDNDLGPNTGGMGSYSYTGIISSEDLKDIKQRIFRPVITHMADIGSPYSGVLYAGLMMTSDGPQVLEFNCRLGDPEAQVILPRLQTDLMDVMYKCAVGQLSETEIAWDEQASVGLVLASEGYPAEFQTGFEITGLESDMLGTYVFCGGVSEGLENKMITAGGRVLTVVGHGHTVTEARDLAYARASTIEFDNKIHRNDIGMGLRI
tara:strand:+ start:2583 stop:3848 length:1266 start_codon:yes stop_codon:yes gene_type:complete